MRLSWFFIPLVVPVVVVWLLRLVKSYNKRQELSRIPTVGNSGLFTSYVTAFQFLRDARPLLKAGYQRYKNGLFKVAQMDRWLVIATGDHVDDLRNARDGILSSEAALADLLQSDYTLGEGTTKNPYHISVIRHTLNKKLDSISPEILNEIETYYCDVIDSEVSSEKWTAFPASDFFTRAVCRVVNRAFVGQPLCRNEDYCAINIAFAHHVMFGSVIINLLPNTLKPIFGPIYIRLSGLQKRMAIHLRSLVEERKRSDNSHDDMLTWVIEAAPPGRQSVEDIALCMLNVNFSALHTTAMTFTHALLHLGTRTEYIDVLRSELEDVTNGNFLDKAAIERCWKLDSFLKESQRLNGLGALSLPRLALAPYAFADGTVIPAGTLVAAAPTATHVDPEFFENPETFDGLRFYKLRKNADDTDEVKYRLTSTAGEYLAFGGGKHVCPGRFFAALEIKMMLAVLIMKYDIRLPGEGKRPDDSWFGPVCTPSASAKVLLKKRER